MRVPLAAAAQRTVKELLLQEIADQARLPRDPQRVAGEPDPGEEPETGTEGMASARAIGECVEAEQQRRRHEEEIEEVAAQPAARGEAESEGRERDARGARALRSAGAARADTDQQGGRQGGERVEHATAELTDAEDPVSEAPHPVGERRLVQVSEAGELRHRAILRGAHHPRDLEVARIGRLDRGGSAETEPQRRRARGQQQRELAPQPAARLERQRGPMRRVKRQFRSGRGGAPGRR